MGSLFDGIGGWQLAAKRAGILPLWSSEIEPFPSAVTRIRFPATVQLGDVTKLDGAKLPPVDIVCAGSPCQGLSVAGQQKGLQDERSGLFHIGINIVHRMREATGGKFPRWFIWENVPGAFSSNKGMDFRAVLEAISQTELPIPYNRKWAKAGMVIGKDGICDIAWRTLDAQFFGVAQRRKRIFLVADFRAGCRCADKILFEQKSLSGNIKAGGAQGKGTAAGTQSDSAKANGKSFTLNTIERHAVAYEIGRDAFNQGQNAKFGITIEENKQPTILAKGAEAVACVGNGQLHQAQLQEKSGALNCMHDQQCVMVKNWVRRYTPRECERLQGLPDDFTLIPDKTCSDAARYKALGNGMAQPCADFIIRRIAEIMKMEDL